MRLFFSRCHYYYYTNISTHQTVHLKLIVLYENCISIKLDKQLKTKMEWGMYQYYQCISAPQVGCLQAASHPSRQGEKIPARTQMNSLAASLRKPFCEKMAVELTVFPDVADLHSIAHLCGQLTSISQIGTVHRTHVALIIIFVHHPLELGFLSQTLLKPNS